MLLGQLTIRSLVPTEITVTVTVTVAVNGQDT